MNKEYINIYNNLVNLSRNKILFSYFTTKDTFSDRLLIFLFHLAFFFKYYKNKSSKKYLQNFYDYAFRQIELDIREIGYGDQSVNKKMKELNKILYDILLKIDLKKGSDEEFHLNNDIISKYFDELKGINSEKLKKLANYFDKFYHFCFELPLDNMVDKVNFFKL